MKGVFENLQINYQQYYKFSPISFVVNCRCLSIIFEVQKFTFENIRKILVMHNAIIIKMSI